jgi:hypothetical protein
MPQILLTNAIIAFINTVLLDVIENIKQKMIGYGWKETIYDEPKQ